MGLSLDLNAGSFWLLLLALIVAVGLSIWTYRHTVPRVARPRRITLTSLRIVGLTLLLFALFQPVFSRTSVDEMKPSMALVMDNSQSMQLPDIDTSRSRVRAMQQSVTNDLGELLGDDRALQAFFVGDAAQPIPVGVRAAVDSLRAVASVTNLSAVFSAVREARRAANIEAIVLYTDGSFTAGENPVYGAERLGVPVYVVGLGDSAEVRDVAVTDLFTNDVATLNVPQPVDLTIHYAGARAGELVRIELYDEAQKLDERTLELTPGAQDASASFSYTPNREGIIKLSARVTSLSGEATLRNNSRLAYISVLKNRFRVALIAGAPSSDVSFIANHFASNPALELTKFIQKQGSEFYGQAPTAELLQKSDLIVLVGFPIAETSDEILRVVRQQVNSGAKPLLFVSSSSVDPQKLQHIADALPFTVGSARAGANEVKVGVAVDQSKSDNPILRIPDAMREKLRWDALPPLFKSEAGVTPRPEAEVLAEASIQGVKLGQPLILSRRLGNTRSIAITGYGLWQWQLLTQGRDQSFAMQQRTSDTGAVTPSPLDLFLGNATRFLTTRDENKRVQIAPSRRFYEAGERIDINAQIYDESYIPIERADVAGRISGGKLAKSLDVVLEPLGNGRYTTHLPQGLPAGDYSFAGTATLGDKQLGTDQSRFNVGDFNIEFAEPRMRSDILRALAERTGGKFYTSATASTLVRDIRASARFQPKRIENKHDYELWNAWPLLLLSLTAFGMEWFLRKRSGML